MGEQDPIRDARSILAHVADAAPGQAGSENFPVALRILPARPRAHLARFYAYARFVDDVGDEAPGDRLELLDLVEKDVRALAGGTPTLPVVANLRPLVDECAVPVECFLDLVEANRMDQTVSRYQTFGDLLDYCRLSANPVGRVVLHVAGAATERNVADSDEVCSGLQVLEHCQDVREDALAGRVYLPQDDLGAVAPDALTATTTSRELRDAIAIQVARASDLLAPGRPLVRRLSGWARLAVAGYVAGGLATADALSAADYDVLPRHVGPAKSRLARHAARLLVWR